MAYADKRAANPGALGLTIGLNAAAVLALALWNPSMFKLPKPPWTTIDIGPAKPLPPPPPPDDTKPQPRQQIDQPDPQVTTGTASETVVVRDPFPQIKPFDPGPDIGKTVIPDPPPPVINVVKRPPMMTTREGELQPPYPPGLQREEIEGSVTVRVLVGSDGRPRDVVLVRADHPDFFAAAKSWGLRHWRFKPASEDDRAVEGWYTLTVKFNIE